MEHLHVIPHSCSLNLRKQAIMSQCSLVWQGWTINKMHFYNKIEAQTRQKRFLSQGQAFIALLIPFFNNCPPTCWHTCFCECDVQCHYLTVVILPLGWMKWSWCGCGGSTRRGMPWGRYSWTTLIWPTKSPQLPPIHPNGGDFNKFFLFLSLILWTFSARPAGVFR